MHHLVTPLTTSLTSPMLRWAERSQQRACRNAMVASTALTRARAERTEVEEYVVGTLARRSAVPVLREAASGSGGRARRA